MPTIMIEFGRVVSDRASPTGERGKAMESLIDIRGLDATAAGDRLAQALGGVGPCDEVLCVAGGVEPPFPWSGLDSRPIVTGPAEVLMALRRGPCAEGEDSSVLVFMTADHARMLALLDGVAEAAGRRDRPTAELLFVFFDEVLRRHAEVEESLLLPIISERHGQPRGPASVLRSEHLDILWALEDLGSMVADGGDLEAVEARALDLASMLKAHMDQEEEIVYALADRHMDAEERASLLDFFRALA
jgi:hemerythrin-like domain-containing protein